MLSEESGRNSPLAHIGLASGCKYAEAGEETEVYHFECYVPVRDRQLFEFGTLPEYFVPSSFAF